MQISFAVLSHAPFHFYVFLPSLPPASVVDGKESKDA